MKTRALLLPAILLAVAGMLAGCNSVAHGPAQRANNPAPAAPAPAADSRPMAIEPQPTSIPEKSIPASQSSLIKTGPDKPLNQ